MTHAAPQQLNFGFEDPFEFDRASSRDATATETQCAAELVKFLLGKRGEHETYVHALFREIMPRHETSSENADILTHHLLGFRSDEAHAFEQKPHSTLGAIWEALVTIIYEQAYPGQLRKDWNSRLALLKGNLQPRKADKNKAEFYLRNTAYEFKYRSGSFENTTKQMATVKYLRAMGLNPVMLCLRSSPNAAEFERAGWNVFEGEDALALIREETGIDPEAVVYLAASHEELRAARQQGRKVMYERVSNICIGHYDRSGSHISEALHERIASDPKALTDVLARAEKAGLLAAEIERICDRQVAEVRRRGITDDSSALPDLGQFRILAGE